jgi:ACS family hexuronate transporter-like MFS transporter
LASIGHGFVKSTIGFIIARSTLGISEAGNFPAAIKSVAEWFPKKKEHWQREFLTQEQRWSYFSAAIGSVHSRTLRLEADFCVDWCFGHGLDYPLVEILCRSGKAKNLSREELQYIKSDQAEKAEEKPKFLYRNYSNIK